MLAKPVNLTEEFLNRYKGITPFKNPISHFVYLRTYSRWLENDKRREEWWETVKRCVEYSFSLYSGPKSAKELQQEAEDLFDNFFNVRQLPSGRTMWVGGTDIIKQIPSANFNCAYTNIDSLESFRDLFYLLMVGCGVGFSTEKEVIKDLPLFRTDVDLAIKPYEWCGCPVTPEETKVVYSGFKAAFEIGDSREGWSNGLLKFFQAMTNDSINEITIDVDSVRPEGSRLKRFGGKSSGPISYCNMLEKIHRIVRNAPEVKPGWTKLRPIDVLDICNIIGENVVAGGVRRTAEIALMDADNQEMIDAKVGYWDSSETSHRGMSNNSIMFWEKPTREFLRSIQETIKKSWEPGFLNAAAANKRRPWFRGFNPCVEILLANRAFCNLVTTFLPAFAKVAEDGRKYIDVDALEKSLRLGVRHALRITNVDIELPEWDKTQKRDRIIGVSQTGCEDAFDACFAGMYEPTFVKLGIEVDDPRKIWVMRGGMIYDTPVDIFKAVCKSVTVDEGERYADEMRIPRPLLTTCVKPEGTQSILNIEGPCSSGANKSFAPFQIRRVRVSAHDAIAKTVRALGYKIYPETGWGGTSKDFDTLDTYNKNFVLDNSKTWVVEFAVKTTAKTEAATEPAIDALNRYYSYQNNWTDHNTSITIQVGDEEWEGLFDVLHKRWDEYIGVSFQAKANLTYDLTPLEAITEEEYNERIKFCPEIDLNVLNEIENGKFQADDGFDPSCSTGRVPNSLKPVV